MVEQIPNIEDEIEKYHAQISQERAAKQIGRMIWKTVGRVIPLIDPVKEKEKSNVHNGTYWVERLTKLRYSGRVSVKDFPPDFVKKSILVPGVEYRSPFVPLEQVYDTPEKKAAFMAQCEPARMPPGAEAVVEETEGQGEAAQSS